MPDWLAVILLGIIEGLTEFLPISSTGHLLLVQNLRWLPPQSELFNVVIQCGAVLAVLAVFWKQALELATQWRAPMARDYLVKLAVAFLVTGVGGLALKKAGFTLPKNIAPIAFATLLGGGVILLIEYLRKGRPGADYVSWPAALIVGLAQVLAAGCPGTSRSGAAILFAMMIGLSRPKATEFAFLVGIPTMFAAGGFEIWHEFRHPTAGVATSAGLVALGTVVSAVAAFLVVKWLLRFVQTHTFNGFGWYRIALGLGMLWLVWQGGAR